MQIYVLVKQTFDTEEKIQLKHETTDGNQQGRISEEGVKFVINPYDEYAVEEAIRIRDAQGGKVTLVSVGPERTTEALRTALAMGADEAVLISDERIGSDERAVSKVLTAYLADQKFELILAGNFSVDHGAGQVAIRTASRLGIPHVGAITNLKLNLADTGATAVCERDAEGDVETVEVPLPALLTAQQGLNEPRYPSLPGIMKAKRKPLHILSLDELGVDVTELTPTVQTVEVTLPPSRKAGRILQGEMREQVKELVQCLRDSDKVI